MKKIMKSSALIVAMALGTASFAQLQDEQDVSITMDLQPILQLKIEGPDQIDFTFDEINKYYAGVTRTGANILKVSASVSFDLWAVGISTGSLLAGGRVWDNPVVYGSGLAGGANNARNLIPLTALELHQFPANPSIANGCANILAAAPRNYDYSAQFAPFAFATNALGANATNVGNLAANTLGNNAIYCVSPNTPYLRPTSAAAATDEKYIAGAFGTGANCQINAGSYLFGSVAAGGAAFGNSNASQTAGGYYFVMDYRILPGLPAKFPSTVLANNNNGTATYMIGAAGEGDINAGANTYAAPGVYTMFVKYVLQEDL